MREGGLEPPRASSLPPQGSASANSATPAKEKLDRSTPLRNRQEK